MYNKSIIKTLVVYLMLVVMVLFLVCVSAADQKTEESAQKEQQQSSFSRLFRSLSMPTAGKHGGQIKIEDDSADPNSLIGNEKHKRNKVSFLLHKIHSMSRSATFNDKDDEPGNKEDSNQASESKPEEAQVEPDLKNMSDEEVIMAACPLTKATCKKALAKALELRPNRVAQVADSIRKKPKHVRANKLLLLRLLELAIHKVESTNMDEKINTAIDLVATKTPYTFAASKALDMASKYSR